MTGITADYNMPGQTASKEKSCTFCDIAKKEINAHVVFEDKHTIAFLDSRPLFPGHLLLIPKSHYSTYSEIPENTLCAMFNNVKLLSAAQEKGLGSDGTFIAVNDKVSQSMPHVHVHMVPRKFKDGLKGFFRPRYKYKDEDEPNNVQSKIIAALKDK